MGELNIGKTEYGEMSNVMTDYSVNPIDTDGVTEGKETEYQNNDWPVQFGYYKSIPELRAVIDARARWAVGKGYDQNADDYTKVILSQLKGFGKDNFNTIIENMLRTMLISGDSFAEIVIDKRGAFRNLKPLDPSTIKIIVNKQGIIKRYEQTEKVAKRKIALVKFKPEQIFHLSRNRTADEIHGISLVDALTTIILMRNEAMADYKTLLHRNVMPVRIWHLDTDDEAKIAAFKTKVANMKENFEDIFIPKGEVETEISAVASNATLNPLPWIKQLNSYFYQVAGVPEVIIGGAQEITEASAKIVYLAFEQQVHEDQIYLMEEIGSQLGLSIQLEFPATLQNEILTGQSKSETMQASTQEDTSVKDTGI